MASDGPGHASGWSRPRQIVALIEAMPHLREAVDEFEEGWEEDPDMPGLYIYVDVIWQWLYPLLDSGQDIDPRFFDWLEDLATSPDLATRQFLSAGLLEVMGDDPRRLIRLRQQMGPATVAASIETEAFWKRPEPENR